MTRILILVISYFLLILFLDSRGTRGCFFASNRRARGGPQAEAQVHQVRVVDKESIGGQRRNRFYLEVEELPNHTLTVNVLPMSSDMIQSLKIDEESPDYTIINETVIPSKAPSIASQLAPEDQEEVTPTPEILTPEDEEVRREWRGSCKYSDWLLCQSLEEIHQKRVFNYTEKDGRVEWKDLQLNCEGLNVTCLRNGWTVNRCQLICMSKCNKGILVTYDEYVDHYGPCDIY